MFADSVGEMYIVLCGGQRGMDMMMVGTVTTENIVRTELLFVSSYFC